MVDGPIELLCSTPGATIQFQTLGPIYFNGGIVYNNVVQTYSGNNQPYLSLSLYTPVGGDTVISRNLVLTIYVTAPGFTPLTLSYNINTEFANWLTV